MSGINQRSIHPGATGVEPDPRPDEPVDHDLLDQIATTELQLAELKRRLCAKSNIRMGISEFKLEKSDYVRYGRQMIVDQIGLDGQNKLKSSKVLVVGAGGLGCPASGYLVGSGIGMIGLVDPDIVEIGNLHRQIAHSDGRAGWAKVDSLQAYLTGVNPKVTIKTYKTAFLPENAVEIMRDYDVVLDCTDNPQSRYLISDVCVQLGKPLISGAAVGTEGQLIVLNHPPSECQPAGPCYRCIFPTPPPVESVVSCADGGIIGPVVGTIGVLQALETIKYLTRPIDQPVGLPSMLVFSAFSTTQFRTVRLRGKRQGCLACSDEGIIKLDRLSSRSEYIRPCNLAISTSDIDPDVEVFRQTPIEIVESTDWKFQNIVILDVRPSVQFGICALSKSTNVPLSTLIRLSDQDWTGIRRRTLDESESEDVKWPNTIESDCVRLEKLISSVVYSNNTDQTKHKTIAVICRRGIDSYAATKMLHRHLDQVRIVDIIGGLNCWSRTVDSRMPEY